MARGDDEWSFLPVEWTENKLDIWESSVEGYGALNDRTAQTLFNEGYFNYDISSNDRIAIREALDDYMMSTYGVDFSEIFDWEAWREAYGEPA